MANLKRAAIFGITFLFFAWLAVSLFMPFSGHASGVGEEYVCHWDDGTSTRETYVTAYPCVIGATDSGITLLRNGRTGTVALSSQYTSAREALTTGNLSELYALEEIGFTRLEKLALYRAVSGTVWHSRGYFVWSENGVREVSSARAEKLVLLSGSISSARLKSTGAETLEIRAEAELTANTLSGTEVKTVIALPPYDFEGGAVYLNTNTARRLVAALPNCLSLTSEGYDYADEGALLACRRLEELTLPFAGNAASSAGSFFHGELAYLFSDGVDYFVPATLKRVNVSGGVLVAHAFYRFDQLEEIDLCGMAEENVHRDACLDCTGLKRLHTPNADVALIGNFYSYAAPCGCTVFERADNS